MVIEIVEDVIEVTLAVGVPGTKGTAGADGVGIPTGGTAGQVLAKINSTNYNTEWTTLDLSAYILANGTRDFSGKVKGMTPTDPAHLATKGYVDALVQGLNWQKPVLDQNIDTPPVGPDEGDRYIIPPVAHGVWETHSYEVTEFISGVWEYEIPVEGWAAWAVDEDHLLTFNGSEWVIFGATTDHGALTGLSDDDHTQYLLVTGARQLTGIQSYDGAKSFTPGSNELASVKYVDDSSGGGGSGKMVIWLTPGTAMSPNTLFGRLSKVTRTNGVDYIVSYLADGVADANDEKSYWTIPIPAFYAGGQITITVYSLANLTNAALVAKFYIEGRGIVHDGVWDVAHTAIGGCDINPASAARDLLVDTVAWTTGLPTAGSMFSFKVYVDHSASTYGVGFDCEVLAIKIEEN